MKRIYLAAAAALLGLAACGGGDSGNQADNQANATDANAAGAAADENGAKEPDAGGNAASGDKTANAAEPAAGGPSATASSPAGEIRALLVGRWSEGDCAAATDFRADNTFTSAEAGSGRWEQSNEYITLSGDRATVELAVQEIDGREMLTINPRGHLGRWTRC
jgi:hypothetical protein